MLGLITRWDTRKGKLLLVDFGRSKSVFGIEVAVVIVVLKKLFYKKYF